MKRRTALSLVAFASVAMAVLGCGISCRTSTVDTKTVLVGTTGDYRPLSYREPETGEYWGFCLDVAGEIAKIEAEIQRYEGFLRSVNAKLSNEKFVANAPAQVVETERKKLADATMKIENLRTRLAVLKK